jgi:N-acetyl sugar amidotransferase
MTARVCTFCVMDDSNPGVAFDISGRCNACQEAQARMSQEWWPGEDGERRLEALTARLKDAGRGKVYDAMIGLSGGVDSAYLAHIAVRRMGLRVLAVHVDGGWNSEPAVRNIESMVRRLEIDLHTHVIEWGEMRDLQLAFLRASVLNQDIPQDHAFFATLYRTAHSFGIRNFLSGVNFSSESVSPPLQGSPTAIDGTHVRGVHRCFGTRPLKQFPVMSLAEYLWLTKLSGSLTIHKPLNYLPYDKDKAKAELTRLYDWRDYGGKHHESRFTKFYEEIYLPRKYRFDKRRQHLSSLIVAGQLTREQALAQLDGPATDSSGERRDLRYIAKKLGIAVNELAKLLTETPVQHSRYPNQLWLHRILMTARRRLRNARDGASE